MNHNCPICNQAGLPDFRLQHTICPQCNSDLRPYLLLNSISKTKGKERIHLLAISLLTICCLWLLFSLSRNAKEYNRYVAESTETIQMLQDSVDIYKKNINKFNNGAQTKEIVVTYIIKKGDSMWKIAHLFYGKGSLYKNIEKDNNLQKPYSLRTGQLLNIKLIQS
jgi:hypothetical protein